MNFLILRRRDRGVPIPSSQLKKLKPIRADVHIHYCHSDLLGRPTLEAWVFNPSPGTDIIPRLYEANVNGMAQGGLNISGMEEIDGALYAQSWWCRVE